MNELAIFTKYWEPGRVKTRLGAQIGLDAASQIYRQFVVALLERLQNEADRRLLAYAPPTHRADFEALPLAAAWELTPQTAGDLGVRMAAFFHQRLQAGTSRTVLIGSDSPSLPVEFVREAFNRLETNDVVLGPSLDGGYYLIGMCKPLPFLFEGIDWSTDKVWQQTLQRIESNPTDLSLAILPEWYDIDTLDELLKLVSELEQMAPLSGQTRNLALLCREVLEQRQP